MRKTLQVLALTLTVSAPAYAGDMQFPVTDPPPQSVTAIQAPTTSGNMQNDVASSMTQIALNLLAVLPSLP